MRRPLGNLVLIASSLMLGLVEDYWVLLVARAIHGIGSACINVGGPLPLCQFPGAAPVPDCDGPPDG